MIFPTEPGALYVPFLWKSTTFYPDTQARCCRHPWQHLFPPPTNPVRVLGSWLPCITQSTPFLSLYLQLLCNLPSSSGLTVPLMVMTCSPNSLFPPLAIAKSLGQIHETVSTPPSLKVFNEVPFDLRIYAKMPLQGLTIIWNQSSLTSFKSPRVAVLFLP